VNLSFRDVDSKDYDGVLVPGGWAPDKLRRFPEVLQLIKSMDDEGKLIGQICHAGWVLASADILKGRRVTSTPGIKDDLEHAGAEWIDEAVVIDRNIISARRPPDIPEYMKAIVMYLGED
jgi:protease I